MKNESGWGGNSLPTWAGTAHFLDATFPKDNFSILKIFVTRQRHYFYSEPTVLKRRWLSGVCSAKPALNLEPFNGQGQRSRGIFQAFVIR